MEKSYHELQSNLPRKLSGEKALAVMLDAKLSKEGYSVIKDVSKAQNADIYPHYSTIIEAKKDCYPDEKSIKITETSAEVSVQALVDHTAKRIVDVQKEVLNFCEIGINTPPNVTLIHKWGCDGSSGQSNYKQKFNETDASESRNDSNLFAASLVPIRMVEGTPENICECESKKKILWQNPSCSSTRYCRPIKLTYEKETDDLTNSIVSDIEDQIKKIEPTKLNIDGREISVHHKLVMTMVDQKLINVVAESSSQVKIYDVCRGLFFRIFLI